ncbi:hypothetical protein ACLB2K_034583 [Fragaria x ananassa]
MVRLTADLIWKSPHFFNALKERELDLRGNKIPVIENLGATEDQFDTIDLSDNEIVKLENLPYLNRLGTLIINNNRITRINPNIGEFLPKLHTLVLTNNRLVNLVEIDPLASLSKLQYLSLLDNNITKKPNYRLYVIHKLKSLRVLDFKKVKDKERLEAKTLFSSKEVEEETRKVSPKKFVPAEDTEMAEEQQTPKVVVPTQDQINAIKAAIVNSQTLEEVARLEQALKSGQLPADLKIMDDDTSTDTGKDKDDEMVVTNENEANAEVKDVEEQKNNESEPMDQEQEPSELNEEDLRVLISHIEETDGGPPWKLMMEQSIPSLTYKAWYRDPPTGPPQYRTRTVFENVSPEILRDFFWDDEFRPRWDKMLIHSKVLSTCLQTGTMIVHWIRKLPLFCSAREYIIIRRIWESATGYYCVTKGTPYPSLPRLRRPKRVDVYHSSWCIRPVKSRNADQQTGSEVLLFHYEDIGLPQEVVKMGVRAGMWNMVKKLHLGVQIYNMEKANDESPSYYAIMAHITTKLPASPSTIMYHIPQVEADENACQNQNPQAQAIESS